MSEKELLNEKGLLKDPQLIEAVKLGDLGKVKELANEGYDVNVVDIYGNTALLWAFIERKYEIAKFLLLECLARLDIANNNGSFPERFAKWEMGNYPEDRERFMQLLKDAKEMKNRAVKAVDRNKGKMEADPYVTADQYVQKFKEGALIKACIDGEDIEVIRELLKKDIVKENIDRQMDDEYRSSALSIAINTRREDIAYELVKAGCDVLIKDSWERPPLMLAVNAALEGFIEKLLQNEDVRKTISLQCKYDHNALIYAVDLLDIGNTKIVKMLLENGAEVNDKNCYNNTALILAFDKKNYEVAVLLIEYGADIEAVNQFGSSPKSIAYESGDEELKKIYQNALKNKGLNGDKQKDDKNAKSLSRDELIQQVEKNPDSMNKSAEIRK